MKKDDRERCWRRFHELSLAVAGATTIAEVGETLLTGALELTAADAGLVALFDRREGLAPVANRGLSGAEQAAVTELLERIRATNGFSEPLVLGGPDCDPRLEPVPRTLGAVRVLILPVATGDDRVLGAMALVGEPARMSGAEDKTRPVGVLICHAATTVDRVRLQQKLCLRTDRSEALHEVTRALGRSTEIEEVFPQITGAMRRLLNFDLINLLAVVTEKDEARILGFEATDHSVEVQAGQKVPVPVEYQDLVKTRRATIFNDLGASSHPSWHRMVAAGLKTMMAAPLLSGRELPGVLVVASRTEAAYGEPELQTLEEVADRIAPAIDSMRLREALQESKALYETLLEAVPDAITVTDLEGRITYATERAVQQHGGTCVDDLVGLNSFELIAPEYRNLAGQNALRTFREGTSGILEYELLTKSGERRYSELHAALVRNADHEPRGFIAITRDITQRKVAEEQVRKYQERLRSLAMELSLAEERLRRSIAAELHDDISQTLVLVKLKLAALRDGAGGQRLTELDELRHIVDQILGRVQSLIWEVSSPILAELGLEAAVQWLIDKLSRSHGLAIRFLDDTEEKPVAEDIRLVLFQAIRELLINVARHAETNSAEVMMRRVNGEIEIEVNDKGVGFDPSDAGTPATATGSFGLFSIRERLGYLGGRLVVQSKPGAGTRVMLVAPVVTR